MVDLLPYVCCKLNRFEESILHRLRIGVIGLNLDLFRLSIHSTGHCNNCIGRTETVNHFLTECPKYIIERATVETDFSHPQEIMTLLKVSEIIKQKAAVSKPLIDLFFSNNSVIASSITCQLAPPHLCRSDLG